MSRINRRDLCWLLMFAFASPLLGCGTESPIAPGIPADLKGSTTAPKDVKDMEKDMMNQKAKPIPR